MPSCLLLLDVWRSKGRNFDQFVAKLRLARLHLSVFFIAGSLSLMKRDVVYLFIKLAVVGDTNIICYPCNW